MKKSLVEAVLHHFPVYVFIAVFLKLLIPLFTHPDFELHRDELLYLAMADHLDWGYLEVPPMIAILAWIAKYILGGSIYAVRFLPALGGAVTLYLVILIVREMKGGRLAEIIALLSYLLSLVYLRSNLFFQPVTFNLLFYVLCVYILIRIFKTNKPFNWILLGIVIGLGLLNKYTLLLFAFGLAVGLLLTPYRKLYRGKWIWISSLIALIIWMPNLFWQHSQNWPFFDHMRILSERQLANVQPQIFTLVQLLMNLNALPVWIIGLIALFTVKDLSPFRPLAWLYLSTFLVLLMLGGKVYYLAPAYPMLFATGGVALEKYFHKTRRTWLKVTLFVFIIYNGLILLPIGVPVLSVKDMKRYFQITAFMGTGEGLRWEDGKIHYLPQDYADMLGWEHMAEQVGRIYHSLPDDQKEEYAVFASNYGQAGAIDYYSDKYDLPKCISKGSSYWLWGYRAYNGRKMIIIGFSEEIVKRFYNEVEPQPDFYYPDARENGSPIIIARDAKISIAEMWQILKQYRY